MGGTPVDAPENGNCKKLHVEPIREGNSKKNKLWGHNEINKSTKLPFVF